MNTNHKRLHKSLLHVVSGLLCLSFALGCGEVTEESGVPSQESETSFVGSSGIPAPTQGLLFPDATGGLGEPTPETKDVEEEAVDDGVEPTAEVRAALAVRVFGEHVDELGLEHDGRAVLHGGPGRARLRAGQVRGQRDLPRHGVAL